MKRYKSEEFEIDFKNPLGKGGFGEVYKATEKETNKVYAIKRISINKLNEEEIGNMIIMNKCDNSIKYYEFF